jgi:ABC-type transport system involved in cytochrome c biogenesis permease subunit
MTATLAFGFLIAAVLVEIAYLFRRDGKLDPVSPIFLSAAVVLLAAEIAQRSLAIRFLALTSMYESLVFLSWVLAILALAYRYQKRLGYFPKVDFGATLLSAAFLALASSPLAPRGLKPPVPALQSGWLVLHISFAFVGEALFALSFAASIAYLLSRDARRQAELDRVAYTAVAAGYPIFTLGALIFGAIWAERAWGTWWSWDPKETWAAVTWLVYTAYLHLRLVAKKGGRAVALLSVLGFALTLFTFFGVNFLLKGGLHSYR